VKPAAKVRRSRKGGRTPPAGYRVVTVGGKTRYVRSRKRTTTKKTKGMSGRNPKAPSMKRSMRNVGKRRISSQTTRMVGRYGRD
jgi:hypothetical protein